MRTQQGLLALLIAAALVQNAPAVVITPTTISYVNAINQEETAFGDALADENHIIDGSGLDAVPTEANYQTVKHAGVTLSDPGNAWATIDTPPGAGDFYAEGGIAPIFEMGLGGTFLVDELAVWGYHFGGHNGNQIKTVDLEFSTDGGSTYHSTLAGLELPFEVVFDEPVLASFAPTLANFIRMTVVDNQFGEVIPPGTDIVPGGDRVGLAELRFLGEVPEPTSAALLAIGAVAALAGRRRRAAAPLF